MYMKILVILASILAACSVTSCSGADNILSAPVTNFDVDKYLGKWYEIARTDNRFEKGCTDVTANYSLRKDGGLSVVNKCFVKGKEKIATGRAYFKNEKNVSSLKVTFFWPFYGNYNVVYIDKDYQYAVVDGGSKDYLWILARQKTIDDKTLKMLLEKIKQNGFDSTSLIYTVQHG
jgi:apolipoprotein D and lipocalin family protein